LEQQEVFAMFNKGNIVVHLIGINLAIVVSDISPRSSISLILNHIMGKKFERVGKIIVFSGRINENLIPRRNRANSSYHPHTGYYLLL
jgi:hypothetical protein